MLAALVLSVAVASQRRKDTESKYQVAPLPPEPPKALVTETQGIDFHISPLLKTGGLSAQIRQSLNDLIRDTHGETIVKLRAFVAGAGDARQVQAETVAIFTEHKLPLPTLTILQVGALGEDTSKVVIEAVVATHRTLNPFGLAFFAGQTGPTLTESIEMLKRSAAVAGIPLDKVLTTTCITGRLENFPASRDALHTAFPGSAINLLQGVRDASSEATVCEAVAQLTQAPAQGAVTLFEKSRVTLVNSPKLIITGLQLSFGSFLDDAHEAYVRLQQTSASIQPVDAPVRISAFTVDPSAASALRKTSKFPLSSFTIEMIEGLSAMDATGGVEAVLAPNVAAPVPVSR
jgi:hypothetical protein